MSLFRQLSVENDAHRNWSGYAEKIRLSEAYRANTRCHFGERQFGREMRKSILQRVVEASRTVKRVPMLESMCDDHAAMADQFNEPCG